MEYSIEINYFGLTLKASSDDFLKLAEIQEFVEATTDSLVDFDGQDEDFEEDEFGDEDDWSDVEYDEEGYAWWFDDEDEVWYIYDELNEEWVEFEDDEEEDECEED
jgi:hypothetical protein